MKRNGLDQIEEAIQLLRDLPARGWLLYAAGAIPLSLSVLKLVRDMTSGYGAGLCLEDSLSCMLVFWWGGFWKARFARALFAYLDGGEWGAVNSAWQCAFLQGVLQGGKLLLFPLAAVSVVPMPWFSVVFRNVSLESNLPGTTLRSVLGKAARRAAASGRQNWLGVLICGVTGLVVFINLFIALLALPHLFQTFTGAENGWTRNANRANVNVFAIAIAGTWLILDPVWQAYTMVGAFYYQARRDGRDLLVRLRQISAAALLCLFLLGARGRLQAAARQGELSVQDVRRNVQEVTQQREFEWVRYAPLKAKDDWLGARLVRDWDRALDGIRWCFDKLGQWWDDVFGRPNPGPPQTRETLAHAPKLKWLLYGGAAFLIAVTGVLLVVRRKKPAVALAGAGVSAPASAAVEDVLATERPHEEWLALARQFTEKGDLRLAVRAMYLSNLSYLGKREFLGISKSKSNSVYERELRNRCRVEPVCLAFSASNRDYERVWYGMYAVTPEIQERFERQVGEIRSHA